MDLAREERLKKGDNCIEQFKNVFEAPKFRKLCEKPTEVRKEYKFYLK